MNELEKVIYINNLFQLYGSLLSKAQQEIIQDYYEYNLSISEIAENRNTSRSAVEDALKKGVKKLMEIEEKINVLHTNEEIKDILNKMKNASNKEEINKLIEEIERRI